MNNEIRSKLRGHEIAAFRFASSIGGLLVVSGQSVSLVDDAIIIVFQVGRVCRCVFGRKHFATNYTKYH